MNVQEIAQNLINELQGELGKKSEEQQLLTGAIQGVNLLYTKLIEVKTVTQEESKVDEQNSQPKSPGKKAKGKK